MMARKVALDTAEYWAAAPAYDTWAFWTLVLSQRGAVDVYRRPMVQCGFGAAGAILCTRDYAENRQAIAKARSVGERCTRRRTRMRLAERIAKPLSAR